MARRPPDTVVTVLLTTETHAQLAQWKRLLGAKTLSDAADIVLALAAQAPVSAVQALQQEK